MNQILWITATPYKSDGSSLVRCRVQRVIKIRVVMILVIRDSSQNGFKQVRVVTDFRQEQVGFKNVFFKMNDGNRLTTAGLFSLTTIALQIELSTINFFSFINKQN